MHRTLVLRPLAHGAIGGLHHRGQGLPEPADLDDGELHQLPRLDARSYPDLALVHRLRRRTKESTMQIGAVLPHHEIGTDPGALRSYVDGVQELGMTHLPVYDHVLGADRNRPGGFEGPYDKDVAFHEPLTFFAFAAGVTQHIDFASTVLILPQRQAVLVAKQAAEVAIVSGNR